MSKNNNNTRIDEEVERCRQRLRHCPWGSLDHLQSISDLSNALFDRFQQLGGIEYLEESITYYRQQINLYPIGNPCRPSRLNNLAIIVCTRFEQLGRMEDLEEAITCHREALALCPHGHPDHLSSLSNLGGAVSTRFEQLGRMEDLEEAITCHRDALALCPHGHPDRSSSLDNLANAVSTRFEQLGRMEDLEEAITCHHEALALRPYGHPDRSSSLNNLAIVVSTCFEQLGRMEDLEEAITCHHEALALHPHGHPNHSSSLNNLANAVSIHFEQLGRMEDLEEAITYYREALALRPHGHPDRSSSLNNLATAMSIHFEQLGRMEDLEEAITCHREALVLRSHGHPDRSSALNNLANSVSTRFEQLGRMEDLEEVITCHRKALALHPHGHPDRSSSLNNLAIAVSTRFKQLGRMEDLEEGITYYREALALRPHGHPNRSSSLNNLANALSTRLEELGRVEDLEEVITCHREALALRPHGHPDRASSLNNLANAMSTCFEQLGRMEDLEEAITCHHEALALRPYGHPDRSSSLNNLAIAVSTRFEQLRMMEDLLDAVKYLSEAKTILPTEHPNHAAFGSSLASKLLMQCDNVPKSDESVHITSKAFDLFEHAANHTFASVKARFNASVQWAQQAHHRNHQSTVDAYAKSLALLDRCLILAPDIESQQKFLASVPKALALDAASSAVDRGEFRSAIELLEQGRALLWSRLRGYRHPLDKLRTTDEELVDQFEMLSIQLEHLAMSFESWSTALPGSDEERPVVSFEVKMQQHRILSGKWDDVVGKIRQIDGFADFLQAVPFATLHTAAAEGPIIIVNISEYRSDAIILQDAGNPVLVPLPSNLPELLDQLSSKLVIARASDFGRQILPVLRSLWDNIAFPVRAQLVALGVPDKSRIWWCPTSGLCALPLHAAGAYSPRVAKPNNLPDCYVSSYTPTLSALIRARSGIVSRSTNPNLLVIAQPDETLPEVKEEIRRIQQILNNVDVLEGPMADQDTVLSGLRTHSWAHFACHGHLNDQPFHSSFQLHNHSHLALVDLIRAQLPDAELAFLSACHSAAGDMVGTPDEVIHLAAALQFCGFRSVVGTLWAMEDVDGRDVAEDFYRHMFRTPGAIPNFRDSAEALNLATREMRKRGLGLDRWIKFVHIGA
jgi:tetratricopeptide (TPR) repeat protein